MQATELWKKILISLRDEVNTQIFNTWFEPLSPVSLDDEHLFLETPHSFIRDWIEDHYIDTLNATIRGLTDKKMSVRILVNEAPAPKPPGKKHPVSKNKASAASAPTSARGAHKKEVDASLRSGSMPNGGLNPKYNFDSFVVGSSNQFARAAALAVAENPARSYNPLFIYGGVGLGKTHLMHAIGHLAQERNPELRLCYMSSERFMNELINSLRFDRMPQFRETYRTMDILLVDDIQFIAGKERTQEEFFHTFNTLFDSHKQIVVSSDKYPREIPDLEERLRSRFEWGLVADIQPPDLETKVAILEKKGEQFQVSIPQEVALFLAENTTSNIRELEGYLLRVIAFATIRKTKNISMELTREALKNFLDQKNKVITVEDIQKKVSVFYNVKISDLKAKKKNKTLILPRHTAMYLIRKLTDLSLPEIGRYFGGRDHTTVLHAIHKIHNIMETDSDYVQTIENLTRDIEGNT
ncbi:MAG: chromosomal replication initiator protein DnaA [Deltaproteobacteria bacterium]|nr:chromosomal replication initiator protein DnaA [Deltaproteobacteria bacterium]